MTGKRHGSMMLGIAAAVIAAASALADSGGGGPTPAPVNRCAKTSSCGEIICGGSTGCKCVDYGNNQFACEQV